MSKTNVLTKKIFIFRLCTNQNINNISFKMRRNRRGTTNKPPSHLRGKAIGMYYRNLYKDRTKKEEETFKLGPSVSLSTEKINEIRDYLNISTVSNIEIDINNSDLSNFIHDTSIESEFKKKFLRLNSVSFEKDLEESVKNFSINKDLIETILKKDNKLLHDEYIEKIKSGKYIEMDKFRQQLPTFKHKDEILRIIRDNQVVVICGDTGCGKTTQVAQYILDEQITTDNSLKCKILCTQPRRISAITIAERVAEERIEKLGESVGYQIRLDHRLPQSNRGNILYCTSGILLKLMEDNKALLGISHLILDEIHERDIVSDLTIGMIKKVIPFRKDLKIILMSATMRADLFAHYFHDCPIISIEGKIFPVEEKYLEDVLEEIRFDKFQNQQSSRKNVPLWVQKRNNKKFRSEDDEFGYFIEPYIRSIRGKYSDFVLETIKNPETETLNIDLIEELIFHISMNKPPGSILVFLPGYDKISKLFNQMERSNRYSSTSFNIFTLHSMMPGIDQKKVFIPSPNGIRKIILATNIAETSITIDDVVYVIDCGKIKFTTYDIELNVQVLKEQWVALANAVQRRGRAGRVQPGICYHLFTRARKESLAEYILPEILRTRLESTILTAKILCCGISTEFFSTLIDVPDSIVIEKSINLLERLNAIDENENLTPLGLHLAQLPLEPQIGKMILMGAIFSCVDPITSIAASISFKDAFYRPLGKGDEIDRIRRTFAKDTRSDHLMTVNVFKEWENATENQNGNSFCYKNFLSNAIMQQLKRMKGQFCEHLKNSKFLGSDNPKHKNNNLNSDNKKLLKAIICSGLYPNIAIIKNTKVKKRGCFIKVNVRTVEDGRVDLHPSSVNCKELSFDSKFLVYNVKQKSSSIFLHDTTMVNPWAILFFGDMLQYESENNASGYISVSNSVKFQCDQNTYLLIADLRNGLNLLLQKKLCKPSEIEWDGNDGKLLRAIVHLISLDGKVEFSDDDDDDEDDYFPD